MYDVREVTYRTECGRCGGPAVVVSKIGPSDICEGCADKLLAKIHGARWPALRAHLAGRGKKAALPWSP